MEPAVQLIEQRSRASLANGTTLIGRATADLRFDREQCLDPLERLACDRGVAGDRELVEGPAYVSPAADFDHASSLVQAVEAGIAIRLQNPVVVLQMRSEERRVGKECRTE